MNDQGAPTRALEEVLEAVETGGRPAGGAPGGQRDSGVPSLGGENITLDGQLDLSAVRRIPRAFFDAMPRGHLRVDDVLVNKDGAQTGKVAAYGGQYVDAAINEHLYLLRGKRELVHQRYLYWVVRSETYQRQISRLITGSAQPGLNRSFLKRTRVTIPDLGEQQRIAEILDTIDEAVKVAESLVVKLNAARAGALASQIASSIGSLGTTEKPLGEVVVAPVCYGIVQPGPSVPAGVPMVAIRDLNGTFEGLHRVAPSLDGQYARSRIQGGDVLVSVKGTIGRTSVVPGGFSGNISRDVARLRPTSALMPEFLEAFLRSGRGQTSLTRAVVGTTRAEVSIGVLARLVVPVPTVADQSRVVDLDSAMADRIASELAYQRSLVQIRNGLTADLLSGRMPTVTL